MVVVTIVIAVPLVVALVYIVALLRSHADILRRLAVLEERSGGGAVTPIHADQVAGDLAFPNGMAISPVNNFASRPVVVSTEAV